MPFVLNPEKSDRKNAEREDALLAEEVYDRRGMHGDAEQIL